MNNLGRTILVLCVLLSSCNSGYEDKSLEPQHNTMAADQVIAPPVPGSIVIKTMKGSQEELLPNDKPMAFIQGEEIHLMLHGNKREDGRIFIKNKKEELVKMLYAGKIKHGVKEFSFQHEPLPLGNYDLYVTFDIYEDTILHLSFNKIKPF